MSFRRKILGASLPVLAMAAAATAPGAARAQAIELQIDEELASQLGLDADSMKDDISGVIGDELHLTDQAVFCQQMADAAVIASKGMGVEYASDFKLFTLGGSLGSGVNSGGFRFNKAGEELPDFGFAFQASAMAGVNLGVFTGGKSVLSRVRLYVNGLTMNSSGDIMQASLTNLGAHIQLKLIKPKGLAVVKWGGIDLTSGYEYAVYGLSLQQPMPISTELDGNAITWDAVGTYDISASTTSIPIELSTSLHVMMASAFLGGALDISDGVATNEISLEGDIVGTVADQEQTLGNALVISTGEGSVTEYSPRIFGGIELSVLWARVYGQLNVGLDNSVGGHIGLRVAL